MLVLGIDPGTASTGYGVVRGVGSRLRALAEGVIQTRPGVPLERRLADIHAARRGAAGQPPARGDGDRGAVLRRQRPHRVRSRSGARRRAAGRRPAGVPVPLLHAPAGQGRRYAATAAPTRTRSRGWWRGCSVCSAADAGPRRRRAGGGDLPPQPGSAGAGGGGRGVIALISGKVAVRRADHVVVDCGGVGYRLAVSARDAQARSRGRATR